ncbi:hypothetical protein G6F68_020887 [Rhizopus microsporus]|nr:hypothetical protein G6F68_020887 [Rhizopus microsporus]
MRALASSTWALLLSRGGALPAATRRSARRNALLALSMLPRATRTASCATAASKNAAITADRKPARAADRSRCALSRDRPADLMRAPRLPPVGMKVLAFHSWSLIASAIDAPSAVAKR